MQVCLCHNVMANIVLKCWYNTLLQCMKHILYCNNDLSKCKTRICFWHGIFSSYCSLSLFIVDCCYKRATLLEYCSCSGSQMAFWRTFTGVVYATAAAQSGSWWSWFICQERIKLLTLPKQIRHPPFTMTRIISADISIIYLHIHGIYLHMSFSIHLNVASSYIFLHIKIANTCMLKHIRAYFC